MSRECKETQHTCGGPFCANAETRAELAALKEKVQGWKAMCGPWFPWDGQARKRLADAETVAAKARAVLSEWQDKQGHDRCWYYPDLFRSLAALLGVEAKNSPELPPLEEFKEGCRRYQKEQFPTAEKPDYYYKGSSGMVMFTDSDPEVHCSACNRTFRTDAMDAACRLCGAYRTLRQTT